MSRGEIFVPETGQTFKSAAEAGRALGVDASNISKVLRGKRQTAGGYHFERREKDRERDKILKQIKAKIKLANRLAKEARRRNREGFLDDLNDLMDFGRTVIGDTPDNYIDDASDVLDDMDMIELKDLNETLDEKIRAAEKDVENADERMKGYADAFGISSAEMEKYEYLIPEINRTLERARANGEGTNMWYKVSDAMQNGMPPEDLESMLEEANRYFDNPTRGKSLMQTLSEWERKQYGGKTWEEMQGETIW